MPEQEFLDLQYNLARYRNLQITEKTPSKSVLYWSSKYKKERETEVT